MWQLFNESFNTVGLIPHGYCLQWKPLLLWTLVASDSIIAGSYFSIPFAIWYFAKKRPDISKKWLFLLFGLFIIACGTTHFFDVLLIWQPNYWINAVAKVVTAAFSIGTAVALWYIMPVALRAPSVQQLEYAQHELKKINAELELRVRERTLDLENANDELKSALEQAYRFRESLDHIPTSIYMKDLQHRYVYANKATLGLFKCTTEELIGCDDSRFFPPETVTRLLSVDKTVLENGEDTTEEIDIREADGSRHVYWEVKTPIYDDVEQNRIWGLCGISTDITERKQMTEAIAASENEFRTLAESMPQIVWVTRADGWNTYFNKQWVDYTGLTLEESYGHGWNKPFHPEDQKRAWDAWQNAVNNIATYSLECKLRRADGVYRWWLIRGVPVLDDNGRILKWFGTCTDIHDIKAGEEKLKASEERHRSILQTALDGFWEMDIQGRFLEVNDAYCQMMGFSREELLKMRVHDMEALESPEDTAVHIRKLMAKGFDRFETRHRCKNGQLLDLEISANFLSDQEEWLIFVFSRDVTERKQAEQALKESEAKFQALVEQSIAGTYIIQGGKLAYVNPRFSEILGYSDPNKLLGKELMEIVSGKDRGNIETYIGKLENFDSPTKNFVFTALRNDGSMVEVGIACTLANYQHRQAIIGMMQDISDKKVAEQQIQRYTEQLKRTFMQTVSLTTTLSEMRDPYTAGHERRVADLAVAIGCEIGLNEHRLEGLKVGGYLHDVGKTSIPLEILSKPGKITSLEYDMIKLHCQAGYEVLKDVDFPWPVAQIALQHHERLDGSGYPNGLKGEEILLEARIIAVADVVEAMASHRPYRAGLGIDKALAEIERGSGTAYDPAIVDSCLVLFRNKGYELSN
jgi:PAS domain S-box-containing protein